MMVTTRLIAVVLGLSLVSGSAVAGKVYKWVDANGLTHYGEQPPVSGGVQTIRTSGTMPSDHDTAVKNLDEIKKKIGEDAQARAKKKEQDDKQSQAGDEAAKLKENCEQSRKNLKTLQEKSRIQMDLPNGEKKILSDEEKQAKVRENEDYLKNYCGEGKDKKTKK
ncbi:MAG TPA: DUF4124 domain-containing protein [Pseudomonadales bacterium]|nr:DUF4124 domain-containing protein [Pseudomonadales bacterium]